MTIRSTRSKAAIPAPEDVQAKDAGTSDLSEVIDWMKQFIPDAEIFIDEDGFPYYNETWVIQGVSGDVLVLTDAGFVWKAPTMNDGSEDSRL